LDRYNLKQKIKFSVAIFIIVLVIAIAIFTVLRYNVEGEKNMPFNLGKIIVISSAVTEEKDNLNEEKMNSETEQNVNENGDNSEIEKNANSEQSVENNDENYLWNEKVIQTNDVYIYIDKNMEYKEQEIIKNVHIENIQILQNSNIGKIQIYMPNSLDGELYKYTNDFIVNSKLTYIGASSDNRKTLEIGNQGGCICLSFANIGVGDYKSNDDMELASGAQILEKMGLKDEDLKFKVSFDLVIDVIGKSYKTNIVLDLPIDGLVGNKESHTEITDFSNTIFKRM